MEDKIYFVREWEETKKNVEMIIGEKALFKKMQCLEEEKIMFDVFLATCVYDRT